MGSARHQRAPWATAIAVSVGAHVLLVVLALVGQFRFAIHGPRPTVITLDLVAAPPAPPSPSPSPEPAPEPAPEASQPPQAPKPKPTPAPPRPRPPRPRPVEPPPLAQAPQAPAPPAAPPAPPDEPTPPAEPATPPAEPWVLDEPAVAAAASADLAGAAPGNAQVFVALRLDRLVGTPWAAGLERLLAPLPDYRSIMSGAPGALGELFDFLFIATPDVQEVTETFLAAHHRRGEDELRTALGPTVRWRAAAAGPVGERGRKDDPRLFLVPAPSWMVLARPELLGELIADPAPLPTLEPQGPVMPGELPGPGSPPPSGDLAPPPTPPRWLARLAALRGDDVAGGVLATLALGDLGDEVRLPGLPALPAPSGTLLMFFDRAGADGLRVVATLTFTSEARAKAFVTGATALRAQVQGSPATRFLLRRFHADGAVEHLTLTSRKQQVAITTELDGESARALLAEAGAWSERYFATRRR